MGGTDRCKKRGGVYPPPATTTARSIVRKKLTLDFYLLPCRSAFELAFLTLTRRRDRSIAKFTSPPRRRGGKKKRKKKKHARRAPLGLPPNKNTNVRSFSKFHTSSLFHEFPTTIFKSIFKGRKKEMVRASKKKGMFRNFPGRKERVHDDLQPSRVKIYSLSLSLD